MDLNNHNEEMKQIRAHVKMLNITGGIAISALALAGYLLISEPSGIEKQDNTAANEMLSNQQEEIFTPAEVALIQDKSTPAELTLDDPKPQLPAENIAEAIAKPAKNIEDELLSFDASCNGDAILFNWVTSGGAKYAYEIEKTYDKINYEVFSRAPQPEKKEGKNFYAVEETAIMDDDAFYRLRKVLSKGKFEYSDVVNVKCKKVKINKTEVDVFPNGYGSFRIVINAEVGDSFKVSLHDINDTELATEMFEAKPGSNEFVLSSTSITRGNYVLRVTNGQMVKEKKVVLK